jgi:hypothetical protein
LGREVLRFYRPFYEKRSSVLHLIWDLLTFTKLHHDFRKFHQPRYAVTGLANILVLCGNSSVCDATHHTSVVIRRETRWAETSFEVDYFTELQCFILFQAALIVRIVQYFDGFTLTVVAVNVTAPNLEVL